MKKRVLSVMCMLLIAGLCACGNAEGNEVTDEIATNAVQGEEVTDVATEPKQAEQEKDILPEDMQPESQEEVLPEDVQILGEHNLEKEVREEEEPVLEQEPKVFEEIATELTTYPVIKYTIMGQQKQIDYTMYESLYPYNMVSDAEYAIGYSTGDVTGDDLEELIVSIYAVGNTHTEALQDTYVYCVDADINDLKEILYISCQGGEQFAPGYPNNVGALPSGNGTLQLNLLTAKGEGETSSSVTSVELVYQDGMWSVK